MMNEKMLISEIIRKYRLQRGFSQEFVAKKLNLTQQAYAVIEKNPEKASYARLKEISEILDVDFGVLLGIIESPFMSQSTTFIPELGKNNVLVNTQLVLNIDKYSNVEELDQLVTIVKQLINKNQSNSEFIQS